MNVVNVSRDEQIIGGLAVLLVVALLLFPWFDSGLSGPACSIVNCTSSATGAPDGWLGVLAMIAALAIVVDLVLERLSPQTQVPQIGGTRASTRFVLAAIAVGFVALKFLLHIHFSYFGWGFYVTVVVAAALMYVTLRAREGRTVVG